MKKDAGSCDEGPVPPTGTGPSRITLRPLRYASPPNSIR
jgi:hypothetical protein